MNDQTDNQTTELPEESTDKVESLGLNINDLAQVKVIIEVAASRGAFKPAEMTIVGETYTKISSFLESVTKGN